MAALTETENNEIEITSVSSSLSDWRLWCRLCAKDDLQGNINVFLKNEHTTSAEREGDANGGVVNDLALATAIGKYFWVNVSATVCTMGEYKHLFLADNARRRAARDDMQ